MFQIGLAEALQADREREIAELIRQRRLLKPDTDGSQSDDSTVRRAEPRAPRARAQAAGR